MVPDVGRLALYLFITRTLHTVSVHVTIHSFINTFVLCTRLDLCLLILFIMSTVTEPSVELSSDSPTHGVSDAFFVEESAPQVGGPLTGSMPVVNDTSEVQRFLQRPILLASYSWTIGGLPYLTIDPWTLFLTDSRVKEKIAYFSRLRGRLILRANVSGTPYHFGYVRFCYRPHPGVSTIGDPMWNLAVAQESSDVYNNLKIVGSQLTGTYMNPCYVTSAEISAPYIHFIPGISLGDPNLAYIGDLCLFGFVPLAHANGGTNPVTIDLFAHMVDVTLDVPTAQPLGFTLAEAKTGVSRLLSATARATSLAGEWVPRLLTAAAMFGFSRPLTHEVPTPMRITPFALANYDSPDTCEVLALSGSAEHTLGGQELSCSGEDEMMLSRLAARPSYIISTTWSSLEPRGTFLFGSIVTPQQANVSYYTKSPTTSPPATFAPVRQLTQTPCAFASSFGRFWKCTMVYKITVVASPYHQGRLRIYTDPRAYYLPTPNGAGAPPIQYNVVNSTILNLAETHEVTLEIPWVNNYDMLPLQDMFTVNTFTDSDTFGLRVAALAGQNLQLCNGIVVCEVLSKLTAPVDGSVVYLIVEVSAKDMVIYSPSMQRNSNGDTYVVDSTAVPYTPFLEWHGS